MDGNKVPKDSSDGESERYTGTQLLGPQTIIGDEAPLIICFHGSGDSCESWLRLARQLSTDYRVLLYDRGPGNLKPSQVVQSMSRYLSNHSLPPPYVLVAHSYGGTFARAFIDRRPHDVVGCVLAETGQETALDPKLEKKQYQRQILGRKPLSVIRANSLIGKWQQYETAMTTADADQQVELMGQKQLLEQFDREDERLKTNQLKLSSFSHYVHIPDCGHHIVRDRPDVVAQQVSWVMHTWTVVREKESVWEQLTRSFGTKARAGKDRMSELLQR